MPSPQIGRQFELESNEYPGKQPVQTFNVHVIQFRKVAQLLSQLTTPPEEL
jgi:hypothetical protein